MFQEDDYVWADVNGIPTEMVVINPHFRDGVCECCILSSNEKIIIPEGQLNIGSIPDEPSYISRRAKRRHTNFDSYDSDEDSDET